MTPHHMKPLNKAHLEAALPSLTISVFDSLPSTNDFLKQQTPHLHLCLAEQQTAGRGRLGKTWFSPHGMNLYFSLLWPLLDTHIALEGLSLVVALSIVKTLTQFGIHEALKIKWPNDIYADNKKLAGILIESQTESRAPRQIIIGVGLNVNMPAGTAPDTLKPWTSLQILLNRTLNRHDLVVTLTRALLATLTQFSQKGFIHFLPAWHAWDYLAGKNIHLKTGDHTLHGIAQGVNEKGHLLLRTADGHLHALASAEII